LATTTTGKAFKLTTVSVQDLLDAFASREPWTLHVAQRAFEWPRLRVTNLVDSILRGFPIGTILLAESTDAHYELSASQKVRRAEHKSRRTTQILDGQQRCLAIRATFGGEGLEDRKTDSRVLLWINVAEPNEQAREFDQTRGQSFHFHWSDREGGINHLTKDERKLEGMPGYLPHSGWLPFHTLVANRHKRWTTIARLAMIDEPSPHQEEHVRRLLSTLNAAVDGPSIPIHHLSPKFSEALPPTPVRYGKPHQRPCPHGRRWLGLADG
jgi:hypothetical protein